METLLLLSTNSLWAPNKNAKGIVSLSPLAPEIWAPALWGKIGIFMVKNPYLPGGVE
jgi:hypothetical protein